MTLPLLTAMPVMAQDENPDKLVINELMQSNIDCIMDDLNEFPDSWVELYNPTDQAIELSDYKIGTSDKLKKANALPSRKVPAKGFVVIYCDKSREDDDKASLHTDFRLESGKDGAVCLFKGDAVVDQVTGMKKQPAPNIAYGRETDGADKWGYQLTPTPGKANTGGICDAKQILGEPIFSEPGRVTAEALNLKLGISAPEGSPEGTIVRYTTDGTEPNETSKRLRGKIHITQSTVVKARLFCDGWLSPRATAQSYISHGRDVTIPVVSISIDNSYLDDSKIGIYANNGNDKRNDWRRPLNIEFFFDEGKNSVINQLCEARVAGGQSRNAVLKTLAIYANKRFGEKRFNYEFFPDDKPGLTDFKSLMLRNAGNDFDYLYMRDPIIQRNAARHIDLDWQAYRPAVLYINGQYRGMLNIRERSNEDNIYTNYDGLEDLDMFENWWELKEGSWDNYNAFKAFYEQEGHTLAEYEQWMDVEEFINLMIINLYHTNFDFPGNNIVMWRPLAQDGRWRWIMKDTDFGLGLYGRDPNYKIMDWLYNPNYDKDQNWANKPEHTVLFRHLMDDADARRMFIDRCYIYMGDFLNQKRIEQLMDQMMAEAKPEIVRQKDVNRPGWAWWGYDAENSLNDEIKSIRTWLSKRGNAFSKNIADYYKLGTPITLTISQEQADQQAAISFNGHRLSEGTFNGKFIKDHQITLQGDEQVNGWLVKTVTSSGMSEETITGPQLTLTMPQCNNLSITALTQTTAIRSVESTRLQADDAVYDLQGRKVAESASDNLPRGIYIINGKKVVK